MKRNLPLTTALLPLLLLLSACQPSNDLQLLRWEKGNKRNHKSQLKNLELRDESSTVSLNQSIQFQVQKHGSAIIEDSYIKNLKNAQGEEILNEAMVSLDQEKLKALDLKEFENSKPQVLAQLKERIPAFRQFEILKLELIISKKNGFHEPLWKISYFDAKGIPWALRMNNHFQVRSIERMGSQFHDAFAIVYPKGPKLSALSEVLLQSLQTTPALSSSRVSVQSQAPARIENSLDSLKFTPQDNRFDQVQAFYFLDESIKWMESSLGVKLPFVLQAEVHVGSPDKTNTAFYYQGKIRLGAGDDITYSKIPQDPTIVVHESIHGLVEAVARLPYEGEGGSLNEAFADFFTALQVGTPHMGEAAYLKGPFRRTVNNNYKLSDRRGTLYFDSGIISGLLWELKIQLGADKTKSLALLTLNRLTPVSDFADFDQQLRVVITEILTKEEQGLALKVLAERGF